MEGIPEEEKGLAKTLLEDFGRFPSAEQRSSQLQASQRLLQGAKGGGSTHTFSHTQEADPAHVVGAHWRIAEEEEGEGEGEPLHAKTGEDKKVEEEKAEEESGEAAAARKAEEEALALKEEGNRLLAAGDVLGAEKRFSSALALAPDNAAMLLNRSLARLKLAETQGNNTGKSCLLPRESRGERRRGRERPEFDTAGCPSTFSRSLIAAFGRTGLSPSLELSPSLSFPSFILTLWMNSAFRCAVGRA
eukprot:3454035-Rhodomonas_salina.5